LSWILSADIHEHGYSCHPYLYVSSATFRLSEGFWFLSDKYSRLGENGLPKRGLVVVWCSFRRILVQARFAVFERMYDSLRRASWARLSEMVWCSHYYTLA